MPASEIGGSSNTSGTATHATAAATKTARTRFSPDDVGPSLRSSSSNSFRPPGIRSISGLNSTLVSRSQVITSMTTASGSPTSIHWPKPSWMPCSALR